MKKWIFVAWFIAGVLSALGADKPNIIIYVSDDHSQFDCSVYGKTDMPVPHMEKLAADGMVLTHVFIASPSCAPSRAAMLTALMPARNGAEFNHTYPKSGTHSMVNTLKESGYKVYSFGKIAHGKTSSFGFEEAFSKKDYSGIKSTVTDFMESKTFDGPVCLMVGISNPHTGWPEKTDITPESVKVPEFHVDTPLTRKVRASYYDEIRELDVFLGELRELAAKHLGDNVLFIHTSDHGAQMAFGKWNLYDYSTRVPFIAAWPGKIPPGTRSDAMASWVDLFPTLVDLVGGTNPDGIDGRSFASVLLGKAKTHRDTVFATHSGATHNTFPIRMIRKKKWKLVWNLYPDQPFTSHIDKSSMKYEQSYWPTWEEKAKSDAHAASVINRYRNRPEFELYNMDDDPYETNNLAANPEYASKLAELKNELEEWMEAQGDDRKLKQEGKDKKGKKKKKKNK